MTALEPPIYEVAVEQEDQAIHDIQFETGNVSPWQGVPRRSSGLAQLLKSYGATHWFSATANIHGDDQNLPNLIDAYGDPAQMGSDTNPLGDTNDPVWLKALPHDSVWFPGTEGPDHCTRTISSHTSIVRWEQQIDFPEGYELQGNAAGGFGQLNSSDGVSVGVGVTVVGNLWVVIRDQVQQSNFNASLSILSTGLWWDEVRSLRYVYDVPTKTYTAWLMGEDGIWSEPLTHIADGISTSFEGPVQARVGYAGTFAYARIRFRTSGGYIRLNDDDPIYFNPDDLTGWSINRSETGLKTTIVPKNKGVLVLDGVDDYIQLPDDAIPDITATTGELTAFVVQTMHHPQDGVSTLLDYQGAAQDGIVLECQSGGTQLRAIVMGADGSSTYSSINVGFDPLGKDVVAILSINNGELQAHVYTHEDGLVSGTVRDMSGVGAMNIISPRIGSLARGVGDVWNAEIHDFAQFGRALTEPEIIKAARSLLAGEVVP